MPDTNLLHIRLNLKKVDSRTKILGFMLNELVIKLIVPQMQLRIPVTPWGHTTLWGKSVSLTGAFPWFFKNCRWSCLRLDIIFFSLNWNRSFSLKVLKHSNQTLFKNDQCITPTHTSFTIWVGSCGTSSSWLSSSLMFSGGRKLSLAILQIFSG